MIYLQRINMYIDIGMKMFEETSNMCLARHVLHMLKIKRECDFIQANKKHREYINTVYRGKVNSVEKGTEVKKAFFRIISENNPRIENCLYYMSWEEMNNLYLTAARIALVYKVDLFSDFEYE